MMGVLQEKNISYPEQWRDRPEETAATTLFREKVLSPAEFLEDER